MGYSRYVAQVYMVAAACFGWVLMRLFDSRKLSGIAFFNTSSRLRITQMPKHCFAIRICGLCRFRTFRSSRHLLKILGQ